MAACWKDLSTEMAKNISVVRAVAVIYLLGLVILAACWWRIYSQVVHVERITPRNLPEDFMAHLQRERSDSTSDELREHVEGVLNVARAYGSSLASTTITYRNAAIGSGCFEALLLIVFFAFTKKIAAERLAPARFRLFKACVGVQILACLGFGQPAFSLHAESNHDPLPPVPQVAGETSTAQLREATELLSTIERRTTKVLDIQKGASLLAAWLETFIAASMFVSTGLLVFATGPTIPRLASSP